MDLPNVFTGPSSRLCVAIALDSKSNGASYCPNVNLRWIHHFRMQCKTLLSVLCTDLTLLFHFMCSWVGCSFQLYPILCNSARMSSNVFWAHLLSHRRAWRTRPIVIGVTWLGKLGSRRGWVLSTYQCVVHCVNWVLCGQGLTGWLGKLVRWHLGCSCPLIGIYMMCFMYLNLSLLWVRFRLSRQLR